MEEAGAVAVFGQSTPVPIALRRIMTFSEQTATVKEGLRITVAICGRLPLVSSDPLQYRRWTIPAGVGPPFPPTLASSKPVVSTDPSLPHPRPMSACPLATPSTTPTFSPPLKSSVPRAGSLPTPVRGKGWSRRSSPSTKGQECASESSKRIPNFLLSPTSLR